MRKTLNMNADWSFHDGDFESPNFQSVHDKFTNAIYVKAANCGVAKVGYNLHSWDTVQLPHDLRHYRCEFTPDIIDSQGSLGTGVAWYRKEFFIDKSEKGNSIVIEFDGVFRDSEVFVNGNYVGRHLSGYTSFSYDVSDFILYGENNAIAVKVDGTIFEGWWYEAAGIYRDVRMIISDKLKIKEYGVYVVPEIVGKNAEVTVNIELENESQKAGKVSLNCDVIAPSGEKIKSISKEIEVKDYEEQKEVLEFTIENVLFWDIDAPENQYKVEVSVEYNGKTLDNLSQKFGVRDIEYSADKGVILNGRQVKIQGVCVHDDFAGVGGAMSRAVIRHKIYLLKQWGCNGYRSSHNPPSPYLIEACDDFGLLVMDEVRLMNSSKEYMTQMTDLIRRDRNHPSVFLWSIGNEEMAVHGTLMGVEVVNHLLRVAHKLDSLRPCCYANNCNWKEITEFHEANGLHMDVFGFNYHCIRNFHYYGEIHKQFPDRFIIGTENASTQSTRGQYLRREEEQDMSMYSDLSEDYTIWSNLDRKYHVSAYGDTYPKWGATPLETMAAADFDYVAGYFIWTGFDYRGEVGPFTYPSVVTRFGVIDLCGFMKDMGHHYRVKWASEPTVYMYPHWTFPDDTGEIQIDIVSNTDEVELFVNGISQGRKPSPLRDVVKYFVPYEKGEIIAVAYNNGKEVTRIAYKTASKPEKINLEIVQDRDYIANGEDNIFVKVDVLDKDGNHCPNADNLIKFSVSGAGEFKGAGNGDPLSHENDMHPQRKLFNGLALAILQTARETGKIKLVAEGEGLESASIEIDVKIKSNEQLVPAPKALEYSKQAEKDAADNAF